MLNFARLEGFEPPTL